MSKRILSAVLTILFLLPLCPQGNCVCETPMIIADSADPAKPGEVIEYSVKIENNPGICSFDISLEYDTAAFSLVFDEEDQVYCETGDFSEGGNIVCAATKSGCRVIWSDYAGSKNNGVLFKIRLAASADAAYGSYPVTVSYEAENTVNSQQQTVTLQRTDGSLTLLEYCPSVSGQTVQVEQGGEFQYSVSVSDNPGLAGYRIFLRYDTQLLEPVMNGKQIRVQSGSGFSSGTILAAKTAEGCQILWMSSSDVWQDGVMFTVSFTLSAYALPGDYTVSVDISREDTVDETGREVSLTPKSSVLSCTENPSYVKACLTCPDEFFVQDMAEVTVSLNKEQSCQSGCLEVELDDSLLAFQEAIFPAGYNGSILSTQCENGSLKITWAFPREEAVSSVLLTLRFMPQTASEGTALSLKAFTLFAENESRLPANFSASPVKPSISRLTPSAAVEEKNGGDAIEVRLSDVPNGTAVLALYDQHGRLVHTGLYTIEEHSCTFTENCGEYEYSRWRLIAANDLWSPSLSADVS